MAERTALDKKLLWQMVQEGKSAQEIMRELNLQDIDTVNNALEDLIQENGLSTGTQGLVGKASLNPRYMDDGIRISPAMLSGKGFKPGDRFRFTVENNRIVLEKQE